VISWAHPSPQPKRHLDRFSRFAQMTAESLYFTVYRPFPRKNSQSKAKTWLPWQSPSVSLDSHLRRDFLGPSEPTTQTASRSVQPLLHRWPQSERMRQTDHATRSVTIGRIYVRTAMRPKKGISSLALFVKQHN